MFKILSKNKGWQHCHIYEFSFRYDYSYLIRNIDTREIWFNNIKLFDREEDYNLITSEEDLSYIVK